MTKTSFDLSQRGFICLSRCTLSEQPEVSIRMQYFTDSRIDLIHCILSCFGYWILKFETYL
jgi:hypothetical protein